MKIDIDVKEMTFSERGQELARLRSLIRTHKNKKDDARCWHTDTQPYEKALPEGSIDAGQMNQPEDVLLCNCKKYIRGQQCFKRGCLKKS
jgi:hypothetical protein